MDGGGRSRQCGTASGRTDGSDTTTLVNVALSVRELCRHRSTRYGLCSVWRQRLIE
ncbi:unnamed protein product [Ectocarpus sp. 6 AP-2014]